MSARGLDDPRDFGDLLCERIVYFVQNLAKSSRGPCGFNAKMRQLFPKSLVALTGVVALKIS
jgi:hypothetical protein